MTWVASIIGVVLAVAPNWGGSYDPGLAILTATYIAIVWYTYVTYRAVHRDEITRLTISAVRGSTTRNVLLVVTNPTTERRITVRIFGELWRRGARQPLGMNAETLGGEPLVLSPGREFAYLIEIDPAIGVRGSPNGPAVDLGEPEFALLRVEIDWEDDLGAAGHLGPDTWSIGVLDMSVSQFARVTQSEKFAGVPLSVLLRPIDRAASKTDAPVT
jgi:membrane protein implicated in regulation of membrane protease activity